MTIGRIVVLLISNKMETHQTQSGIVWYIQSHTPNPNVPINPTSLFIFIHGAGQSAQTFNLLIQSLHLKNESLSFVTYDSRGHGASSTSQDDQLDLDTLSQDLHHVYECCGAGEYGQVYLVGHSMGGAVAIDGLCKGMGTNVRGLVVLDVVEGSALESLVTMKAILSQRPSSFESVEEAVEWA